MYRSWAYILMVVATLAGVVGLLWPSPSVRTIEEIAMPPARSAPARGEAPAKAVKPAGKPAQAVKPVRPEVAPAEPPAILKRMPPQTTSTRRAGPALQNGMEPNMFGKPAADGVLGRGAPAPPPARPGGATTPRPVTQPAPATEQPSPEPGPR